MKKTAILLASSAAVIAAPAQARDDQWFIGLDAGVTAESQVDIDNDSGIPGTNAVFADTNTGLDVAGVVGYDFGAIRLEGEVAYKRAGYDTFTVVDPTILGTGTTVTPGTAFTSDDSLSVFTGMLNALLEFGSDDSFQIYGGGGVGVAAVNLDIATPTTQIVDDESADIAWQLIGGFRYPINDRIDLGLRYRYFQFSEFQFLGTQGNGIEADSDTHSLMASLRINLGKKAEPAPEPVEAPPPVAIAEPPPPPPVTRPAPAPRPKPACNTGPYIVFFDWDESAITAEAANTLDQAASAYDNCGTARVMLAGHTDRSGSVQYNIGLAERRNISVGNYLMGKGIPGSRISAAALGESQPRVATPDGVREQENRRVEVTYGPGSGM